MNQRSRHSVIVLPGTIAPIAAVMFFMLTSLAEATTVTVTNLNDSGAGSLRDALAIANDGDTITFAVTGTITLSSGELLAGHSITISGPGAASLTVNGNANSRVFHVASGTFVTISGLTITKGNAFGSFPDDSGAGIYNDHATATLNNCTISRNSAYTFGGGIFNDHATLTVNGCTLKGNFADNTGGGLYSDGSNGSASASVVDTILAKNSAFSGGAIYNNGNAGTATLEVSTSVLTANSVIADGGAIYNDHASVTLTDCTISGNSADGNGGGGIFNLADNQGTGTIEISSSTLSGNSSNFNGGAVYSMGDNFGTGDVQILNSTLSGNSAVNFGGAVYNRGTFGTAILQIENSTFADNLAQASGDSIYNYIQSGFPGDVTASFVNTIFKTSASGQNFFNNGGTMTSLGYNLGSDDGGGYLTGPGDQINSDPLLGPLQNNGGPTSTQALLAGSSAIDSGNPNFTPPPDYDQRGAPFVRVVNNRIDIGAFEVQPTATPTPTPTPIPSVKVNLSISPTQINEGQTATYTVTASSTVSQSITVGYAMSGSATNGTDYKLSGAANQVTIPAGQSSATVTLKSKADGMTEGTETATMTLQPGSGYKVGRNNQATVSILDSP
jgi:hypothetical protein